MIDLSCENLSAWCIWLYVFIGLRTKLRVTLRSTVCLKVKENHARSRFQIWSLSDSSKLRTRNHLVRNWTLNHLAKLAKW